MQNLNLILFNMIGYFTAVLCTILYVLVIYYLPSFVICMHEINKRKYCQEAARPYPPAFSVLQCDAWNVHAMHICSSVIKLIILIYVLSFFSSLPLRRAPPLAPLDLNQIIRALTPKRALPLAIKIHRPTLDFTR